MTPSKTRAFHLASPSRRAEFAAAGHRERRFFPHRVYRLPKCGPDGFKLAKAMTGIAEPAAMWQLLLYADESLLGEFPRELFFDDELNWHREQFGRPGQVASASLVLDGDTVHGITYVSDLVQRIALRREFKTRVEKVFEGWRQMIFNAVLGFALDNGAARIRTPASGLAMTHTDPARREGLGAEMYERIYDRTVTSPYPARRDGDWWVLDADAVRELVVPLEPATEPRPLPKTICIHHDLERGLGHLDSDPGFARIAEESGPRNLDRMLDIEEDAGVRATYSVVGSMLEEVRERIEAGGHAIAFHSYDHLQAGENQLGRCRAVDYRIKGYRPPQSVITPETSDANLLFHNFEWLANGRHESGLRDPVMQSGLVRIPIERDDYAMHSNGLPYEEWEADVLGRVTDNRRFAAISLHDCYAEHWLEGYAELLGKLGEAGELRTVDEVAAEVVLSSGS